jgi:hypothetical protein
MKKMKIFKQLAIIALVPLFWSCEKKFLELEPISELTDQNYYTNTEQIESGIYACYDGLQNSIQIEFMLTEMRSDNAKTLLNEGDFGRIDMFLDDQNLSITQQYWEFSYNTIMRANTILANLDVVTDATTRIEFEAEVRFIRALNYFNLVRIFGDVPLIDRVILSSDADMFKRVDEASIYSFIKSDLTFGVNNLPAMNEGSRPTNYTAQAMLGKVHLTLGEFSDAKTQLASVIAGPYSLESNYVDVFSESNELNPEIVFAIEFKSQSNDEGQSFSYEMTTTGEFGGLNNPTNDFIMNYEANDSIRRDFCVTNDSVAPMCGKYLSNAATTDAGNDWPVLRFADVLLMYGEAVNELNGPTQEALDHLNFTRERAGLPALTSSDVSSAADYRMAMENERRYELAFENHRWFDLLRTGRVSTVMTAHGADEGFSFQDYRSIYAIPQREIDVSGGQLTQNTGY